MRQIEVETLTLKYDIIDLLICAASSEMEPSSKTGLVVEKLDSVLKRTTNGIHHDEQKSEVYD